MSKTTAVYARIDTDLKENAESILKQLGISPANAIQMLYSQIVLTRSMPLKLQLPTKRLISINDLTDDEVGFELAKGIESLKNKTYSVDDVDEELSKEFGI